MCCAGSERCDASLRGSLSDQGASTCKLEVPGGVRGLVLGKVAFGLLKPLYPGENWLSGWKHCAARDRRH